MDLGVSGLASGFDWRTLVDQLVEVERVPQNRLRFEQNDLGRRNNSYGSIRTQLGVLQNRLEKLQDPAFFNTRLTTTSDQTLGTASASTSAANGTHSFNIIQLAKQAEWRGASDLGAPLSSTSNVSSLVLSSAGFSTSITAGDITVNGKRIAIATSDTLQQVFTKISDATSGSVTGSYDPTADKITLASTGNIVLGSSTDTSNFLEAARLYNNGTSSVTSSLSLGGIRSTAALSSANFRTTVSDGGAGAGAFKINGVTVTFNATSDNLNTVIQKINDSDAGVRASYDPVNDRVTLRNEVTGDSGVALADVTGNFLSATGLLTGTLERGKNLRYSVNGGPEVISTSNVIRDASSGITGLTVTALKEGTLSVTVASDTAAIKEAISGFLDEYNRAQTLLDRETASSTDSKGKVTAGILANDTDPDEIAARLRTLAYGDVSGLSSSIRRLEKLGIDSNGDDNTLKLTSSAALDEVLSSDLTSVRELFTNGTGGIAIRLKNFLEATIGDEGTLTKRQDSLAKESGNIDSQITNMERLVQANQQRMIASFVQMEVAQQQINQQLQFLTQRLASTAK